MCVCEYLQVYRNAECASCNRVTSADCNDERTPKIDVDDLRRELFGPPLPSSSLVLVIDLNAGTAEVHNSVPRRLPGVGDPSPPVAAVSLSSCRAGEVYDPYDNSCRPVGCSSDGGATFGSSRICPSTTTPEYFSILVFFAMPDCFFHCIFIARVCLITDMLTNLILLLYSQKSKNSSCATGGHAYKLQPSHCGIVILIYFIY